MSHNLDIIWASPTSTERGNTSDRRDRVVDSADAKRKAEVQALQDRVLTSIDASVVGNERVRSQVDNAIGIFVRSQCNSWPSRQDAFHSARQHLYPLVTKQMLEPAVEEQLQKEGLHAAVSELLTRLAKEEEQEE